MKEKKKLDEYKRKIDQLEEKIKNLKSNKEFHSYYDLKQIEEIDKELSNARSGYIYWLGQYHIKMKGKDNSDSNHQE